MRIHGQTAQGVEPCPLDLPHVAHVTQGLFSPRYASTTPVMYSTSRSLMAKISDNVNGSGCCAQLTGQFAVEEMIDPFEEQLHGPPRLVDLSDHMSRESEVVGEELEPLFRSW
jgi:hypothetical protein